MQSDHHTPPVASPTTTSQTTIDPVVREEIWQRHSRLSQISWGAIFAGIIAAIAINWLLNLFGLTIGVTIADVANYDSVGSGLGWATIIWMTLSMLAAYYIGACIAARLSGRPDETSGMLHGVTVWGLGTIATLVMVSMGVSNVVYSGYQVLSGGTQAVATATTSVIRGTADMSNTAVKQLQNSMLVSNLSAQLKQRATQAVADSNSENGPDVTPQDVRQAIDSLDDKTMTQIGEKLIAGDTEAAKNILAENTDLTQAQINSLVQGISQQAQEQLGTEGNNQNLTQDVKTILKNRTAKMISQLAPQGGSSVSENDIRQALDELSVEDLQRIGMHLIEGRVEPAKNVLVTNTNLTTTQVNEVVDSVYEDVKPKIEEYKTQLNQTMEAASNYSQAVLWSVFVSSALALCVSILGGRMGAEEMERIIMKEYSTYPRTMS